MGGLDGSAAGVAENEDDLGSEDSDAVFEATDDFRRRHIAGDTGDEDVSDGLVEDDLDRHARIGAGEDGGKRLLLIDSMVAQDFQVLVEAGEAPRRKALVAIEEGLEGFIGREIALGEGGLSAEKTHRGAAGEGGGCAGQRGTQELAA
jgi:hypothetical protein